MTTGNDATSKPMRGATHILTDILSNIEGERTAMAASPAAAGADKPEERLAAFGDILDRLDERAFGLLLLLLALPCCLPFVYLLPQLVALPMLALAGQMAAGRRHPWLPESLHRRSFSVPAFEKVLTRSEKYVGWVERFARPRLALVTSQLGSRLVGALLLAPTASILVPLPSTNTVPGIGVAITALGLIERDGLLVILGLLIGFIWIGLLAVLGVEAAHIIKAWLSAHF